MIHLRSGILIRKALCALSLFLCATSVLLADAEQDWNNIVALDVGPKGDAQTRDQARQFMLKHFDQVETSLRAFISKYPADSHNVDAHLRLSHLYAIRGDLEEKPADSAMARKILDDLEADKSVPEAKLPDIAYARITLFMHNHPNPDAQMRDTLTAYVMKFQRDYPGDHRSGALFAEVASLYDADPEKKRELLEVAQRYADEDGLKQRINDDFKRLGMLGRPLELKFDSIQGAPVNVEDYRGKVVMVYFFASWSPVSAAGLAELKQISALFPAGNFQVLAISLDKTRDTLDATLKKSGLNCPVYFDGKGWESPLVRSLGINALPTAWVVDRKGNLRSLNAIDNTEGVIRQLLREE